MTDSSIFGRKSLWLGLIAMQAFPSSSFWSLTICKMDGRERYETIYRVNTAQLRVTVKGYFIPKSNFCMKKTQSEANPCMVTSDFWNYELVYATMDQDRKIETAWKGLQIILLARRILPPLSMLMSHNKCFKCIFFHNISDKKLDSVGRSGSNDIFLSILYYEIQAEVERWKCIHIM